MTPDEKLWALALAKCSFVPGIGVKRFARQMAEVVESGRDYTLSPKQREFLRTAVIRYRRQIDSAVVESAMAAEPSDGK